MNEREREGSNWTLVCGGGFVQKVEFDVLSRAQIENDLIIDILDDLNGVYNANLF